jgi:hypothetical protein
MVIDNNDVVIKDKVLKSKGIMFVRTAKEYQNLFRLYSIPYSVSHI